MWKGFLYCLLAAGFVLQKVGCALTPCSNQIITDAISSNMTLGMALLANATAIISASCNVTDGSNCALTDDEVIAIIDYMYPASNHILLAALEYDKIVPSGIQCANTPTSANCTNLTETWTSMEALYESVYLPNFQNFVIGNVSNCTAEAIELQAMAASFYCTSEHLSKMFESGRSACGIPCCGDDVIAEVNSNINSAMALMANVAALNEASCQSGTNLCPDVSQALQDLEQAQSLFNQTALILANLYSMPVGPVTCTPSSGICDCEDTGILFLSLGYTYEDFARYWSQFSSGSSSNCPGPRATLYTWAKSLSCTTGYLIANFNACLLSCSCCSQSAETNISQSMDQATAHISNVWTAFRSQCPGRFNCASTNLTLVSEDLTQAISDYDLAIANYTAIIKDAGLNATCLLRRPECGCRLLREQLEELNATYYLDYLPEWDLYITSNVINCTAQAEFLRHLVFEQKCIAEQLSLDYEACYERCQTNWCLFYDCANKPCAPVLRAASPVWNPPKQNYREPHGHIHQ